MYELIKGLRIESVYIHTYSAIAFSILFVGISFQAHLTRRRSAILPAILIDMPVCIVLRSNGQRRCTCGKMCVARFLVDFTQKEFHFWCVHVSPQIMFQMFPPQSSKNRRNTALSQGEVGRRERRGGSHVRSRRILPRVFNPSHERLVSGRNIWSSGR